jgi:NTP pyrophosphatase (non-canonical NTP hydrolase)
MDFREYTQLCEVIARRTPVDTDVRRLAAFALGLASEAGEVADVVKKHLFDGRPFDRSGLLEELGDVLWYVAMLASTLGADLGDIARLNIEKLRERAAGSAP